MAMRLKVLCDKIESQEKITELEESYLRLVHPDQMGQIYKILFVGASRHGDIFPFIRDEENNNKVFH